MLETRIQQQGRGGTARAPEFPPAAKPAAKTAAPVPVQGLRFVSLDVPAKKTVNRHNCLSDNAGVPISRDRFQFSGRFEGDVWRVLRALCAEREISMNMALDAVLRKGLGL